MITAADYSDQWFAAGHRQLNVFYICRSGGGHPRLTVQRVTGWARLKDDMTGLVSGQWWDCHLCGAKYAVLVMDRVHFGFPPADEAMADVEFSPGFTSRTHIGLYTLAALPRITCRT